MSMKHVRTRLFILQDTEVKDNLVLEYDTQEDGRVPIIELLAWQESMVCPTPLRFQEQRTDVGFKGTTTTVFGARLLNSFKFDKDLEKSGKPLKTSGNGKSSIQST